MANFWQVLTALSSGSASVEAGRAADETKKLNELKTQELEETKRHNQEILELQKEQLKLASMTDAQKLKYQKQKAKEIDNEKKIEELFGNFDPFDPTVLKAIGEASRDSTGLGALEEGLISS